MRLAFLTPLPPAKTGIAVYAAYILPALARRAEVTAVVDQNEWETPGGCEVIRAADYDPAAFDAAIYQLGNNPYHEWIYRRAMEKPGIAEFHDVVLHHLIVEMTLARGETGEYTSILRENHGAAGEAWARGRIAGWHDEIGNFLFPASRSVADRSRHVLVHNRYAAEVLRRSGCEAPITILNMPFPAPPDLMAEKHDGVVIGMFGFVTDAKRPGVVFRAFADAWRRDRRLRLLIVGQPAPNLNLDTLAAEAGIPDEAWTWTGYVSEADFDRYLVNADRVINLRYPSAGETSGALLRIVHAGKPIAVSDYGPFTDLPAGVATRIPLGEGEHEAAVEFMLFGAPHDEKAQRAWVLEQTDLDAAVKTYLDVAHLTSGERRAAPVRRSLPVVPGITLRDATFEKGRLQLHLINEGAEAIAAAAYGLPSYRLIVKMFDGDRETFEKWVSLAGDIPPGGRTIVEIRTEATAGEVRLYHALQGVPDIDREPFASVRVSP